MEIPIFFPSIKELREWKKENIMEYTYASKVIHSSPSYYEIRCGNHDCEFKICFTGRTKNNEYRGMFLCQEKIHHLEGCKFTPNMKGSQYPFNRIIQEIKPIFETGTPSCEMLSSILSLKYDLQNTEPNVLKYIKRIIMMDRKDPTVIVNYCSSLASKNWNCLQFFEDGMLDTILLFPPWIKRLMKHYPSPIIVDI